jgi:hypothetical protein
VDSTKCELGAVVNVITKENEITHVSFRKEEVNFYFGNIIVF